MVDLRKDLAPLDVGLNQGRTTSFFEATGAAFQNTPTSLTAMQLERDILEPFNGTLTEIRDETAPAGAGPRQAFVDADGNQVLLSEDLQRRLFDEELNEGLIQDLYGEIEAGGGKPAMPFEEWNTRRQTMLAERQAEFESNADIIGRSENPFLASLTGGIGASFTDPVNLATIPIAAPQRLSIMGTVAFEGALNAVLEGLSTPARNDYLRAINQEEESVLMNMLIGGAFGVTAAGGIELGKAGFNALPTNAGKALSREMDAILGEIPEDRAVEIRRQFFEGARAMADPEIRADVAGVLARSDDPEIAAFGEAVMRDAEDESAAVTNRTPEAETEHTARAQAAYDALNTGQVPNIPDRPVNAVPRGSIINGQLEEVDPRELQVDPDRFQYKSEARGAEGLTGKLDNVPEWRTERAGVILVFEDINGNRFVADGHQRTGLARRIMASDPAQEIKMAASVFREADGFSPEQVRSIAALKNISESADGMTQALARDAAKVLRVDPQAIRDLPAGPGIARAQQLSALSDDAFALVINDVVPDRFAAMVGKLIPDDPQMQMAMMRLLERTNPNTDAQANAILAQAMRAPVTETVTEDLFGTEMIKESMFIERAKVLERAMSMIRDDRKTFRTLTERSGTIQGAGNQLNEATNKEMRELMDRALYTIDKLAHRAGPISEALDNGAKSYKESGKLKDAAGAVVSIIRDELERNGIDGPATRPNGSTPKPASQSGQAPDPNQGFSDPVNSPDAQAQIANTRIEDANERPAEGFNSDEEARRDLGKLVSAGADRETLDSHPAVVAAIEQLEERAARATNLEKAYNSPQWHEAREYAFPAENIKGTEFPDEVVKGTGGAMDMWKARAEAFAGEGGPARDRKATILLGPPAAGKSTIAESLALTKRSAIVDSDEIKKTLPEFEGGIGAAAVHKESSDLSRALFAEMLEEGTNITFPKVGDDPASIRKVMAQMKAAGYEVELINMAVTPENAYKRMIGRFVAKGRLIPPDYFDAVGSKPSGTYDTLKGEADAYANIDNNQAFGQPNAVLESSETNPLAGSEFNLSGGQQDGGRPGDGRAGEPDGRAAEETQAGSQLLIDGVAPISTRERVQAAADRPLIAQNRVSDSQIGGLFDANDPARSDLFDRVPVGVETVDGESTVKTVSRADLAAELDADDEFAEGLGLCLK